jgi:hypothetical protein
MFPIGALFLSSHVLILVAGGVLNIDITKTCRNSASDTRTLT